MDTKKESLVKYTEKLSGDSKMDCRIHIIMVDFYCCSVVCIEWNKPEKKNENREGKNLTANIMNMK